MGGVTRFLWLPFLASMLLVLGCGVPIAPEYVTATAVAEEEARASQAGPGSGRDASTTLAVNARTTSFSETTQASSSEPLEPRASATPPVTPTPPTDAEDEAEQDDASAAEASAGAEDESTLDEDEQLDEDVSIEDREELEEEVAESRTLQAVATDGGGFASAFVELLNDQRARRGLTPLRSNGVIEGSATAYARYMGENRFFGHQGLDGSSPSGRLSRSGYFGSYKGEALSAGQSSPSSALNALLASPPHAAILLNPDAVEVGVGYALVPGSPYTHYWVVLTAVP